MSNFPQLSFLVGNNTIFEQAAFDAFSPKIMSELALLGEYFLSQGKGDSHLTALGFWLRRANLMAISSEYKNDERRTGRGLAFHIAPGNVDTLFFYSIIVSVLAGNPTLLRLSSKQSDTSTQVLSLYEKALETLDLHALAINIAIVRYNTENNENLTEQLSLKADVRVVWGSDATVDSISRLTQKEDGVTVSFPDRYSCATLSLNNDDLDKAASAFLTDIKPFYQQACSSPKVVFWVDTQESVKTKFWQLVDKGVSEFLADTPLSAAEQIERMAFQQSMALGETGLTAIEKDNVLVRYQCNSVLRTSIDRHLGLYQFIEQNALKLEDIKTFNHCQTMASFGIDVADINTVKQLMQVAHKRVVPLGQSLVFSHLWDGVDLIATMTTTQNS